MDGRVALLALAALPACGPTADDDDPPAELVAACEAWIATYLECYEGPATYTPAQICSEYLADLDPSSAPCVAATEEVLGCLAELDCQPLDEYVVPECVDAYASAHAMCPGRHSLCWGYFRASGEGYCWIESDGCLDDRTYEVSCDASGNGYDCTCTIDRAPSGYFAADLSCGDGRRISALAAMHCGFPDHVFRDRL